MSGQLIHTTTNDASTGAETTVETVISKYNSIDRALDAHQDQLAPIETLDLEETWTDNGERAHLVLTPRLRDENQAEQDARHQDLVAQAKLAFPPRSGGI